MEESLLMANVKISGLPAATSVAGANEFEINEAGTSKKVTGSQIASYVDSTLSYLDSADIGNTVQGYDVDTTKNDVANTFTANQVISVTDNSNAALRVTQLGTGDAFVVEDSTNPDSTSFVINAAGNTGVGAAASAVATDKLVVGGSLVALEGGFRVYSDSNKASNWLDSTGTTSRFQVGYNPSTTQAYIQTVVSAPLLIATNSVERMRFSVNGGVSFGSSGTAYGTSGQVLQSNGDAAPTWVDVAAGGMTLLGTLTTTSGSTQTLSGLTLTNYKEVKIVLNNVSFNGDISLRVEGTNITSGSGNAVNSIWGHTTISLVDGTFSTIAFFGTSNTGVGSYSSSVSRAGEVDLNTSDTSIVFSLSGGNFDAGTINVYGVK